MEKLYNERFNETYYKEVLDNGLTVFVFYKPDFISSVCAFGTPYGALHINQLYEGKEYHFHPGIAHFLEHKLFETDDKDIMNDFSKIGANVNAFTSYEETVYYFTTNNDIEEPLNMLLDFVQNFSITKESVEKEKGIIAEEVSMYMQNPSSMLLNETYKALYKNYPLNNDIGGTKESVYAITKEELEECYRINYHPSNMALVISSNRPPEEIIEMVKKNQKKKNFSNKERPVINNLKEPFEVNDKERNYYMDVSCDKHIVAYKMIPDFKNEEEAYYKQTALSLLLEACFSTNNPLFQKWLDEGKINDYFGYEIEFSCNNKHVLFFNESDDDTVLDEIIKEGLNTNNINEELLEELKRKYIGIAFSNINQIEFFALDFIKDYLEGMNYYQETETIRNIKLEDVEKSIEFVDNSSISHINIRKNK